MALRAEFVALARSNGTPIRELCRRFNIAAPTAYKWLHRAERDGQHRNNVQNSVKRSVLRWAKQTADQDVEDEIKPANPRRGDYEGPATMT